MPLMRAVHCCMAHHSCGKGTADIGMQRLVQLLEEVQTSQSKNYIAASEDCCVAVLNLHGTRQQVYESRLLASRGCNELQTCHNCCSKETYQWPKVIRETQATQRIKQ